ncbi:MAG: Exoglucanase 1 [Gomphillus americanus]|uniref:Glucanase n=1 Tax=Gomphillus americanus TaxID=1940652 RepID=A0A8H3FH02_9LECA|nr:MAG: Exoglucanase 1 [Gomphillus americanus]
MSNREASVARLESENSKHEIGYDNCALDGAAYSSTYGITTSGDTINLGFVTGSSVGSRVYLMQDNSNYRKFNLLNGEFAFYVDVSQLPCGLNGALYFTQMDQDGGTKRFPSNKAGAAYGTGYCDAQCPRDLKFINGQANVAGWNAGTGNLGSCCSKMDIWEANSFATAYTAHPCNVNSATACTGGSCTSSCDAAGCDFNSWRMGNDTFYGPGLTVDTKSKKITVVTQFITDDKTNQGNLIQINRFYVQNGQVIPNSHTSITGIDPVNSISDNYCFQKRAAFSENNVFASMGGLKQMGAAFKAGMVLVMSIWDDYSADMLWLDSDYPTSASGPGVSRGPCSTSSGVPSDVEKNYASATVSFSNIKWGELNSTFVGDAAVMYGDILI